MKLFNTLTRKKETFTTIEKNKVRIYVCGPTVYNYIHIGNARPIIIFDAFRRFLEYRGYDVNFVQNFTDVDDKIINRSKEEGITPIEVAEKYIKEFYKDSDGLNVKRATANPRVTENIDEIIDMVQTLIDKGHAYVVDGDVYFHTDSFKDYGKLCGQNLEEREAGARIDVDDRKKSYKDFALWKAKKEGEIAWASPWGEGRPGWHIECSVMAKKFLGETIDIHGGGQDLIFPHHENEKAQSECANGVQFARYWVHNGFVNVNNEKMSKSLNNFFTVREISEKYGYEPIRFIMLSVHYRNPINFSQEILEQAKNALERLYNFNNNIDFILRTAQNRELSLEEIKLKDNVNELKSKFIEAMEDDINTADAITAIYEIVKEANVVINSNSSREIVEFVHKIFLELVNVLGLMENKVIVNDDLENKIEAMIEKRKEAKKAKNWAEADRIRDELKKIGVILEDTPNGVRYIIKNN